MYNFVYFIIIIAYANHNFHQLREHIIIDKNYYIILYGFGVRLVSGHQNQNYRQLSIWIQSNNENGSWRIEEVDREGIQYISNQ